jgi:hypothetical protein
MRYLFVVRLLAVALILGCARPASAQIYEAVGTRALGMGGAFVAVADDATASWWNPAGLATGKILSLVVERGKIDDPGSPAASGPARRETANGFSAAFPALALSYYRLRISEIAPISTTDGLGLGREDPGAGEVRLHTLGISRYAMTVGQSLGTHFVVGTSLQLLKAGRAESANIGNVDLLDEADGLEVSGETKTDLDLGAMAALGRLRLGATLKHLRAPSFGKDAGRFELKRQARAGAAFLAQTSGLVQAVTLSADLDLTRTETVNGDVRHLASGIEFWVARRHLGLRSGLSVNTLGAAKTTGSVGVSLGGPSGLFLDAALLFGSDAARNGLSVGASMTF